MSKHQGDDGPGLSPHIGTVVVTGANSALGSEVTEVLAKQGAHVAIACRCTERGEDTKRRIEAELPEASLTVHELDLADLDSVAAFAERFKSTYDGLSVLCNNAGVMTIPRKETADGFEYQFGVNHLGHFALTAHLLPLMQQTSGESRVVTQSSVAHQDGEIDFGDLQSEQSYDAWGAYGQSKLANVLFAYELDRRLPDDAGVKSIACHHDQLSTSLQMRGPRQSDSHLRLIETQAAKGGLPQRTERGPGPMLYAAVNQSLEGGEYVGPSGCGNMHDFPEVQKSSDLSYDAALARRLWEVTEELTGVTFGLTEGTRT